MKYIQRSNNMRTKMYTSIVTGTNSIYERSYINDGKNDQRMRQS